MLLTQYLILVFSAIVPVGIYYLLKKYKRLNSLFYKIFAIIVAVVFFVRFMSGHDIIENVIGLNCPDINSKALTAISILLNWFFNASLLMVCIAPFFNNRTVNNIIRFFVLPVTVLSFSFIYWQSICLVGLNSYNHFSFRAILFAIEIGFVMSSAILAWIVDFKKITKQEALNLLYIIPMLMVSIPIYTFQSLFGYAKYAAPVKDLTVMHRVILYIGFAVPVLTYVLLHKKDYNTKKLCLLYFCVATMINFSTNYKFHDLLNITHWPIHLCNTAMYLMVICLIFKMKRLFYFTLFINVLGAFLAMAMPNYSDSANLFSSQMVNFYVNHYVAFFMPILFVALKMFERPKLKQFLYSMAGFAGYFIFVLIINAWFSNYGEVDYFFINSDFIADKLGNWAERLRDVVVSFNIGSLKFTFYPLYQVIFFVVYCLLGLGMWFIYEYAFSVADFYADMRERKQKIKLDELALSVKLKEQEMGKDKKEIIDVNNVKNVKLELKNFSKKYGSSKNYAVKNANLEINGGEIFGFLGPNGAGKSTIIKSIVGIQPITDGAIEVCGYDVNLQPVQCKKLIGFVPDHYALYEKLTGREYINYIADLYDVSAEDRTKAINKYVKLFELEGAFDNQMKTYSHGMKQKIAIMAALVHNPKVWILDEPLTGLDPNSIYQVKECMKAHAKAGNIVFFSSHIIDVVERICDRIAIIKKGDIKTVKTLKQVEAECNLEDFYLKTIGEENLIEEKKDNAIIAKPKRKKA